MSLYISKFPVISDNNYYKVTIMKNKYFKNGYNCEISIRVKLLFGIKKWKMVWERFIEDENDDLILMAKNEVKLYELKLTKEKLKRQHIEQKIKEFELWNGKI